MNKKILRLGGKFAFGLTAVLIVVLGVGTFVERSQGTAFTLAEVWHAPWFFILLGAIVFCSIAGLSAQRRSAAVWGLHIAFSIILLGAATTHFTGEYGRIHLRKGQSTRLYADETRNNRVKHLPFIISLKEFQIIRDKKGDAPKDFVSTLEIQEASGKKQEGKISVNHPLTHKDVRFTQLSYDTDGQGSVLGVSIDPYGMSLTFTGYALLFCSLLIIFWKQSRDCIFNTPQSTNFRVEAGTVHNILFFANIGLFIWFTYHLGLTWNNTGQAPFTNGIDTTYSIAWFALLLSLRMETWRNFLLPFGTVLSLSILAITNALSTAGSNSPLPPVLNSPLLGIHVALVIVAYTLLCFIFFCSITYFFHKSGKLTALSHKLLFPAVATLTSGIFIGAIWGVISWGRYWGWDAKEIWALITLLLYTIPLHEKSIPCLQKATTYHIYMAVAFLSLLMTFIGVNYLFAGLHSYA